MTIAAMALAFAAASSSSDASATTRKHAETAIETIDPNRPGAAARNLPERTCCRTDPSPTAAAIKA